MQINFPKLPPQALVLALAGLAIASPVPAAPQEPSASLKQADADYREGLAALNRNDLKTAQAKFEDVVRLAPSAQQGHSALGAVLEREGQLPAAIAEFQKAVAIKPTDTAALLNLAGAYDRTGAPAKAIPLYSRAVAAAQAQKHPIAAGVLASFARDLAGAGKPDAAIARMKEAVALQPRDPQLRDDLGSLYAQSQD